MSLGLWPEAVPFDPNSGTASHELSRHFDATALPAAVLLVCARDLRGTDWPALAAIGLAEALSGGEREVLLADVDFERPTLHEKLQVPNSEGVADAILFGASLERVVLGPPGHGFEFVAPGAVAPEPAELMASPAWTRLLGELVGRRRLLLAFAPLGVPGLDALAERIPSVVLLADDSEVAATAAMLPETIRVEGAIRPAGVPPAEEPASPPAEAVQPPEPDTAVAPPPEAEPTGSGESGEPSTAPADVPAKEAARQALQADIEARQRVAAETAGPPPAESARSASSAPSTARARVPAGRTGWRRAAPWALFIVLAVVAGIVGGRVLAGRSDSSDDAGASTETGMAGPAGDLLGYSVAIESYDQLAPAEARADSLGGAGTGLLYYVAPVEIDNATYYRVLAGPMTDSATASEAMRQLVRRGLKIAESASDVRSTPLAFLVGQYEFRGDAEARMNELEAQDVPTYIIEVPYTEGPPRYHVYAGAYSGPTEAAVMRARLRRAGVQDTLVLRVGRSQS